MAQQNEISRLIGVDEWDVVTRSGHPFVLYKYAATLDGRIAAADRTSQWITSAESRREVHQLRAACGATMVGSGTQQADNPHLTVRGSDDPRLSLSSVPLSRQPYRVVVDTNARTPADARVLDDTAPTIIAIADDVDGSHLEGHADVIRLPRTKRGVDLHQLLAALHERGVRCVFLEGGPTLAGSFVGERLVDRVIGYVAPAFLGAGTPALQDAGITTIAQVRRLQLVDVARSGPDVRLVARPVDGS